MKDQDQSLVNRSASRRKFLKVAGYLTGSAFLTLGSGKMLRDILDENRQNAQEKIAKLRAHLVEAAKIVEGSPMAELARQVNISFDKVAGYGDALLAAERKKKFDDAYSPIGDAADVDGLDRTPLYFTYVLKMLREEEHAGADHLIDLVANLNRYHAFYGVHGDAAERKARVDAWLKEHEILNPDGELAQLAQETDKAQLHANMTSLLEQLHVDVNPNRRTWKEETDIRIHGWLDTYRGAIMAVTGLEESPIRSSAHDTNPFSVLPNSSTGQ